MLQGIYNHNIDDKGRMNFPAKMREELGPEFAVALWSENCLAVFSLDEWKKLSDRIGQLPMAQASKIQRILFPNSFTAEPDKQGRILIPLDLRKKAKLGRDVTVIGVGTRAEIWDTGRWNARNDEQDSMMLEQILEEMNI